LLLVIIAAVGCNASKGRAIVKGRVRILDKYLTCGTVGFISQDGTRVGATNIDFEGNYEMVDAPIGDVTITVKVPTPAAGPGGSGGLPKPPPGLPPMRPPGSAADDTKSTVVVDPKKIVHIPGRYGDPKESGLKYIVEPGNQTHDISLSP